MKLIESKWNTDDQRFERTYLADTKADIPADHDPDCAVGSQILVIDTGSMFIKNNQGKWQKAGTNEVIG